MIASKQGLQQRGATEGDSSSIVYIPFVQQDSFRTACILAVGLDYTPVDTIFHMIYPSQYKNYGFDTTSVGWNARDVFHLFTDFDRVIFGYDTIKITDGRLWGGAIEDTLTVKRISEPNGRSTISQRVSSWGYVNVCVTYWKIPFWDARHQTNQKTSDW